ncbi:hypothetical protein CAEBREN_20334 [Caenorhabditis brenneri]|uniref:Uncharacterized protein n=1 Tax=Caenorhabditis brenneri TaxID=135651 RepID=G0MLK7_CAEBE|nr:hypothetical protein CAEBREN_20334 [Caenorhabditis brenneri]
MPDVDLNQKVWGVKAQTHFYGFSMIYVTISFINLVTIIDLMALPSNATAELRSHAYFSYLGDIGITIVTSALIGFNSCLELLMPKPMIPLPSFFQAKLDEVYKYYKYSLIGISIVRIFQSFAKIYLGIVLLKLSFCAPRPVIYVDHRRRSRSDLEQRSGGDEEDEVEEDIEEKPRSKKKDLEKNDKSGKSGNSKSGTGKSEKSLKKSKSGTGKSEKSGKTGNSGN